MKKRLLVSLLCMTLCTAMVAETGAAAFTDQPVSDSFLFTDTAADINDPSLGESVPDTEDMPMEEIVPDTEDVPVEEIIPDAEDVPVEEIIPDAGDIPVEEIVPDAEDVPVEEIITGTEDVPEEDIPAEEEEDTAVDIFISEPVEEGDSFIDIEVSGDSSLIVNQEGSIYDITNWYSDEIGWKLLKEEEPSEPETDIAGGAGAEELTVSEEGTGSEGGAEEEGTGSEGEGTGSEGGTEGEGTGSEGEVEGDGTGNDGEAEGEGSTEPEVSDEYFTAADGIVRIVTRQSETDATVLADGYYYFNAEGYLVTGASVMEPGTKGYIYTEAYEYYYMDAEHALWRSGVSQEGEKTPYTSNLGQLQRDYWLYNGTAFRYYDNSGKFCSVKEMKAKELEAGTYVGYYEINGSKYALSSDGTPIVGRKSIKDGNKPGEYYFNKNKNAAGIAGEMVCGRWVAQWSKTRWRFYGEDGLRTNYTPMISDLGGKYGKYTYLLDKEGYIVKKKSLKVDGVYYYGDSKGRIVKEKMITEGGKRYYYTADGTRATYKNGWYRCKGAKNRYYYFGKTAGRVSEKSGWHWINGAWYYFTTTSHNHWTDKWTDKGKYFREDGSMCSGIVTLDGKKYFFGVSTSKKRSGNLKKNQMIQSGGTYYYADAKGVLLKSGWVNYNGYYYYFKNYKRQSETFAKLNGVNGYLDSTGKYRTGWIIFNNSQNLVKYVNPNGNDFYKNTTAWINGKQYRFDANGYRDNDRTDEFARGSYYVEADIRNCVMTIYSNYTKTVPIKSIRISPGAPATPTPTGTYWLNRLGRWWTLMGPSYGQYCTHVVGAGRGGIIVHSVAVPRMSVYSFSLGSYNMLGNPASHGCLRCCVADAKWVYDNCQGSTIRIFYGTAVSDQALKGPLGMRPLVPATGNFDPTDPAVVG